MGTAFLYGNGGGSSLNFKVVGGATAPESPKENTIWVETATEISGWVFSAAEPGEATEGTVWISTGTSSTVEFNALRKNELLVCPLAAKQRIGGVWEGKPARTYRNGAWVDWWNGELYMDGTWYTGNTGDWVSLGKKIGSSSYNASAPLIEHGETSFRLYFTGGYSQSGMYYLEQKMDLTHYTALHFEGELNYSENVKGARVQIWSDIGTYTTTNVVAYLEKSGLSNGVGTIDVSALNGEYHIGFNLYHGSSEIICRKLYLS